MYPGFRGIYHLKLSYNQTNPLLNLTSYPTGTNTYTEILHSVEVYTSIKTICTKHEDQFRCTSTNNIDSLHNVPSGVINGGSGVTGEINILSLAQKYVGTSWTAFTLATAGFVGLAFIFQMPCLGIIFHSRDRILLCGVCFTGLSCIMCVLWCGIMFGRT